MFLGVVLFVTVLGIFSYVIYSSKKSFESSPSHYFFFFFFLGPHPWHMEVPSLEIKSEL